MTLDRLIAQQNALLQQLINTLQQKQELGFCESPRPKYIYCNRSQGGLWYTLADTADRTPQPIAQSALTCMIEKLEFKQVERRGKETWKMHLTVKADRIYILEAGSSSVFSRGIIASIAAMSPQQIQCPITIEVQEGDADEVLFSRLYVNGEAVVSKWDEDSDWKAFARQAITNIDAANHG